MGIAREFGLDAGQVLVTGNDIEARHDRGEHGFLERNPVDHEIVGRLETFGAGDAETGRRVTLRIEVDDQHPAPDGGQCGAKVDGRRRFTDSALLVYNCKYPRLSHDDVPLP